jgi:hypothetical protein
VISWYGKYLFHHSFVFVLQIQEEYIKYISETRCKTVVPLLDSKYAIFVISLPFKQEGFNIFWKLWTVPYFCIGIRTD